MTTALMQYHKSKVDTRKIYRHGKFFVTPVNCNLHPENGTKQKGEKKKTRLKLLSTFDGDP